MHRTFFSLCLVQICVYVNIQPRDNHPKDTPYKELLNIKLSVSKSEILYLTKQAKIDLDHDENFAKSDANAIIEHFYEIKKSETLACIYLIDSICRDAGGIFIDEFKNHVLDMMKVSYQSIKQKYDLWFIPKKNICNF